jgi:hypothetical protein
MDSFQENLLELIPFSLIKKYNKEFIISLSKNKAYSNISLK